MKKRVKIGFSGFWKGFNIGSFISRHPYLTEKYQFVECDNPDFLFVSVFKFENGKTKVIRDSSTIPVSPVDACKIFYTGENVTPDFSRFDYAIGFSLESTANNFYLPNWVPRLHATGLECDDLLLKNRTYLVGKDFRALSFCNFIYRNTGVAYREDLFNALNRQKFVSAPGLSCNNSKTIGASILDKINYQSGFKFSIAVENEISPGYTTEKISEAFVSGSLPAYVGDPLVGSVFNVEAFLNLNMMSPEEAADRILMLDNDQKAYRNILSQPVFLNDSIPNFAQKENIMNYFEGIFDL